MRVLIAGCGYVGSEMARLLVADGHVVYGLKRDPAGLPSGVSPLARDLTRGDLAPLPPADVVVYAAAPDERDERAYRAVYVRGLENLLQAASSGPPSRLVFTSSTAVYGQKDGSEVDESSPTAPGDYRGRVLLEAESVASASGVETVVMRLGGLYGPGRRRLLDGVIREDARYAPGRFLNLIHRDDAARALRHSMMLEGNEGVYVGVDCEPVEARVLLEWLARATGSVPPREERVESSRSSNKRCSNRRLRSSGFRFRYPTFREGFGSLLP